MSATLKHCTLGKPAAPASVIITDYIMENYDGVTVSDSTYVYSVVGTMNGKPKYYCDTNSQYAWWDVAYTAWYIASATDGSGNLHAANLDSSGTLPSTGWHSTVYLGNYGFPAGHEGYYVLNHPGSYRRADPVEWMEGNSRWEVTYYDGDLGTYVTYCNANGDPNWVSEYDYWSLPD